MDKIHAMQLFIRVADLESFSRAAETLALPKGSVSRQIQALESHLGVRLLHRTTRRVQLTQDGMVYYERAKDLLSSLDELDGMFQHDPASISGRLRVDMPVGFAKKLAIPHLPTFLQQYPGKYVDTSKLTGTDLWIINYRAESLGSGYQGKGNVVMWRYTNQGTVNGVNGKVNISIRYKTY